MKLILCHETADMDAIASMIAAKKLYPDALMVLPQSMEKNVRDLIKEAELETAFTRPSSVKPEEVELLILVDFKRRDRNRLVEKILQHSRPKIHIYDHHPAHGKDISGDLEVIEETGACTTILVEILRKKGIPITPQEATIFLLGIHEDTGSFTFNSTTTRDMEAAAYLLGLGANLNIVSDYLKRELTSEQIDVLNEMINNLERVKIAGVEIGITSISRDKYVGDLAVLAHKLRDMEALSVLFVLARMDNKITIIGRSRTEAVHVGNILSDFGGGGHATAGSATVRDLTLIQAKEKLLERIKLDLGKTQTAKNIMTQPAITIQATKTLKEAEDLLVKYNINAMPVLDGDELVGIITRQTVERALYHHLEEGLVGDYMNSDIEVAYEDTPITELERIALLKNQRLIPILNREGRVVGVVTRGELFKALYQDMLKTTISRGEHLYKKNLKSLMRDRIPRFLMEIIEKARQIGERLGYNVYIVGGFVRDLLLRVENFDLDFVVEGDGPRLAEELAKELGGRASIHRKFETAVVILPDGTRVDVTTARFEYYREPAALPEVARGSIKRDLYRRDFTINAMAIKITGDDAYTLIDYYGGLRDLKEKVIRVIHNLSFVEDPTRAFRAIRFEQRYGFRIGPHTERLIKLAVKEGIFEKLSGKRVFNELKHMLSEKNAFLMVKRMEDLGILKFVNPKLKADEETRELFEKAQEIFNWYELLFKRQQPETWMTNLMILVRKLPKEELKELLRWFGVSKKEKETITAGIEKAHTTIARLSQTEDPAQIYKLLIPYPLEAVLYFMALASEENQQKIGRYLMEWMDIKTEIGGRDLMALGLTPGPIFGKILNRVLEAKIRGEVRTKEEELELAKRLISELTLQRDQSTTAT